MRRPLQNRLTFRLGLALCLTTGVIFVGAGVWNLRLQRRHLTEMVRTSATEGADVIRKSTRDAMMRNSPSEVRRIVETIATQPSIELIRVFDKKGTIRTSTEAAEIGALADITAEQCVSCHREEETLEHLDRGQRARIFVKSDGGRVLGVTSPIVNEPACAEADCHAHPSSQRILGILDVQRSLAAVDRDLVASEGQMILGLVVTALAMLTVAWLLTWRMVLNPVERLTEAATRVAGGDLSMRMPVASTDEIGDLSRAWNSMSEELGSARSELQQWGHTLEQKLAEKTAELEKAHQRMLLVDKMASLGKLAAVVAHEINNPLMGIGTYARVLRRELAQAAELEGSETGKVDGEFDRVLRLIHEEATRCGKIVSNLLLFSRTAGARFSEHELGPLLERCIMLVRHQAELKHIGLALRPVSDLPAVVCDASQIQQAIVALVMNALEATDPGGSVVVSAERDADPHRVVLSVADTGRGIAAERLDKIFEPFFTTKQQAEGVGLGLAVVYGIVNRHHGLIEVDSTPGEGTTFSIYLPLRQTPAHEDPAELD